MARLIRFCVVGLITAVIHYGILLLGVEQFATDATLASSIGFIVAVSFNYLMHYSWTFDQPAPHGRTLVRYLVMIACGFMINAVVMFVASDILAILYLISQALAMAAVLVWNYLLANYWVFRV
ncbi:MAG: GtrA family protein [Halieaceae bacterium]